MQDRKLYSIKEARELLGGISRNGIYALLRTGELPSVVIGCRRFISDAAISTLISQSTTTVSPSQDAARSRLPLQRPAPLFSPAGFRRFPRKSPSI
jgi:Helix-turn-helix domain